MDDEPEEEHPVAPRGHGAHEHREPRHYHPLDHDQNGVKGGSRPSARKPKAK